MKTDTAHAPFQSRENAWFPGRRRDNLLAAEEPRVLDGPFLTNARSGAAGSIQDDARDFDGYIPPFRGGAGDVVPLPFLMATLAVAERHALVHVTMARVGGGAALPEPRAALDATGEVTAPVPQAVSESLPVFLRGRAETTQQRPIAAPIAAIVARYLANAEAGQPQYGRSLYA